jgi:hypothetical protein
MQPWNLGGGRINEEIAVCNNQRNEEMKNKIVRTQNTQSNWRNRRGDTRVQINQTSTRTWNQKLKRQNVEKTMPMNKTRNRGQKIDEAGPAPANSEKAKSMRIQHKRERETRKGRKPEEKQSTLRSVAPTGAGKPMSRRNKRSRGESRRSACYLIMSNAREALSLRGLGDATSVPIAWTSTEPRIKKWPPAAVARRLPSRRSPITLLCLGRRSSYRYKEQVKMPETGRKFRRKIVRRTKEGWREKRGGQQWRLGSRAGVPK